MLLNFYFIFMNNIFTMIKKIFMILKRGILMSVKYNKLWKLLIDKGFNKTELQHITNLSSATIAKLSKGETVTTDVLERICNALDCDIYDIMEIEREKKI